MIVVDFSQTVVSAASVYFTKGRNQDEDEELLRHFILNILRSYKKKFGKDYGEMIIAIDNRKYWRRKYFKAYKANRKDARKKSDLPWESIFRVMEEMETILPEYFGYKVINAEYAEADDVIVVLTKKYHRYEKILILSSDGDFKQLQALKNVKQYSGIQSKFVIEKDPAWWLVQKKITGDKKDGIPNCKSHADHFVTEDSGRQKSITQKFLSSVMYKDPKDVLTKEEYGRYKQNEFLLDFDFIPDWVIDNIMEIYEVEVEPSSKGKIFDYLMANRLANLVEDVDGFLVGSETKTQSLFG